MSKTATLLIIASFLFAACAPATSPATIAPTFTETATNTFQPKPIKTPVPSLTPTLTPLPTATITPPVIETIQPHPQALDLSNVVTKMKKLRQVGIGAAKDVAFSPDGKTLAVAGELGIHFFETTNWTQIDFWPQDFVSKIAYNPDGSKLAIAKGDQILVWDFNKHQVVSRKEIQTEEEIFRFIYGSNDLIVVASGRVDYKNYQPESHGSLTVWQAYSDKTFYSIKTETKLDALSAVEDVVELPSADISPDGNQIATWNGKEISIIDSKSGKTITSFPSGSARIAFSSDGTKILYTTFEQTKLASGWDISTKEPVETSISTYCEQLSNIFCIIGQKEPAFQVRVKYPEITEIAVDKDKKRLALIQEGVVALWNFKNGDKLSTLNFAAINCLAIGMIVINGQQSHVVAIGGYQILLWDIETGELLRKFDSPHLITGLDISPDQRTLASIDELGVIQLWDIPENRSTYVFDPRPNVSAPIKFTHDGTGLIAPVISQPKLVEIKLQTGNIVERGESGLSIPLDIFDLGADNHLRTLGWSPQEQAQAVIDLGTKDLISFPSFNPDMEPIVAMTTNPGAGYVAVGTVRGNIQVANIKSKEIIGGFVAHDFWVVGDGVGGGVQNLSFARHSDLLVSTGHDNIKLWNIYTGNPLRIINPGGLATFTNDDRYLITTDGSLINVWGISEN